MQNKIGPILVLIFLLVGISFSAMADMGPVAPTKDLISQSQKKAIEDLDLPYKPVDIGGDVIGTEADGTSDGTNENLLIGNEDKQGKINWDDLPYVPSKGPDLPHAPDPEI